MEADERIRKINDDITLIESKNGLLFTTDAYLLSAYIKRPGGSFIRAAELGAGTGVVSLLTAARKKADMIAAVEVQDRFCDIMRRNISANSMDGVIECINSDVRDVNEQMLGGQFDFVFSNPPYMKSGSGKDNVSDEKNIARREVFGGLDDFCRAASKLCKYGGMFYIVFRPERTAELFSSLQNHGFEPKLLTYLHPTSDASPSLLFCSAKRGGAPGLCVTRPLFVYDDGTRNESAIYRQIYENGSFPEEFYLK